MTSFSKMSHSLAFPLNMHRGYCALWLPSNFSLSSTFRVGDQITTGMDGRRLRYHDPAFQRKVRAALIGRMLDCVPISEKNVDFWTQSLRNGKFELSPAAVGEIIRSRYEREKTC